MNTADYIIKKMEELGVNDFFGVPSNLNYEIIQAINNNNHTKWVGCTNELNAGYSADGYARVKGYGAVITTYGTGELSLINAVAGCSAENVPVLCLVAVPETSVINNNKNEDYYRFFEAYKGITSAFAFLNRDNAKMEIDRVLKIMVNEKKPAYIALPIDIAKAEISDRYVSYETSSDKDTLRELCACVIDKINNSTSPLILGDVLIKRFNAELEYREFVSKSMIPTTNFLMGTNLTDMDAPSYLGGYYGDLRNPIASKYVKETDCMISVGALCSDLNSFGADLPYQLNDHIAIYGNHTYVEGKRYDSVKMSDVLETLTEMIEAKNIEIDKPNIGYKHKEATGEPLTSDYIYPRLQEFFKDNDIVFVENGSAPFAVVQTKFPQSVKLEIQTVWNSAGWATPASFGASLAKPGSRTVLITGDGAHQMTIMEIGNMLRGKWGIKPIVIVINNGGYTSERAYTGDFESELNDVVNMNYAKFSRAFAGDIWATKVETEEDFDKALKVTQIMNKMCYIEVCTSKTDMPNILKDMFKTIKREEIIPETEEKTETTELQKINSIDNVELKSDYSDIKYETVVHKTFVEKG